MAKALSKTNGKYDKSLKQRAVSVSGTLSPAISSTGDLHEGGVDSGTTGPYNPQTKAKLLAISVTSLT